MSIKEGAGHREVKVPRVLFCAPGSGSGKTLITCGFLEILKRRGILPVSYKCGPDYIDPMFHRYVLGVGGTNLDSFFLEEARVNALLVQSFFKAGEGKTSDGIRTEHKKIAVIEGVMGYYDGLGGQSLEASTYDIARITNTPAVLIIDCKGASLSLAALATGFLNFKKDSGIKGVILNRISPVVYERLVPVFEEAGLEVYGYIPEKGAFSLDSRHLGLMMPREIEGLYEKIKAVADQMEKTMDLERIFKLAREAPALATEDRALSMVPKRQGEREGHFLRIGVARDEAFSFYYQENLSFLEEMGAELVYFSPLHDEKLPPGADGLLLGGGYPENFGRELSENKSMLKAVKTAWQAGMPILAECGGFMYLHNDLECTDKRKYPMVGIVEGTSFPTGSLGRFGYITLTGPEGESVKGHEYHYWDSSAPGSLYLAEKPVGGREWRCMHQMKNLLCGFPHLYYLSNPDFIRRWLTVCEQWGKER